MSDHATLVDLLATRSARRGLFTLASGKQSTLYIDARLTTMSPDGLSLIGPLALACIRRRWSVDSVGGLTLGADPISYAIAYASASSADPVRAFTVRKQAKTHGTGQLIEGPFRESDTVVIIEDVITTGASALQAVDTVVAARGKVTGVFALIDREEGGREAIMAAGYPVISLVTAGEITARMPST